MKRTGLIIFLLLITAGCSPSQQRKFVSQGGEYVYREEGGTYGNWRIKSEVGKYSLPKDKIYGKWVVEKYIKPSSKVSMSEKEAKKLIGLELMFNSDVARTIEVVDFIKNSNIYKNPTYKYKVIEGNVDRYMYDYYGVTMDQLPVDLDKINIIKSYKDDSLEYEVIYLKKSNRLMMVWNGYWYFAERPPWYSRLYSWCLSWF